MQEVGGYSERLAKVEAATAASAAKITAIHERVMRLLECHGAVVENLNESLVAWYERAEQVQNLRGGQGGGSS